MSDSRSKVAQNVRRTNSFSQIADVSDSAVTLSSSLSFIKGTALQNHLWWHTSNDNNSTSWGHWGTFNYGIKLGVHFHVYFWAKIWGKSFFFPLVTAWSITDHWNPWIDKCTHHLWSHRYHQASSENISRLLDAHTWSAVAFCESYGKSDWPLNVINALVFNLLSTRRSPRTVLDITHIYQQYSTLLWSLEI